MFVRLGLCILTEQEYLGVHSEDSKHMHLKGGGKEDRCQAKNMHGVMRAEEKSLHKRVREPAKLKVCKENTGGAHTRNVRAAPNSQMRKRAAGVTEWLVAIVLHRKTEPKSKLGSDVAFKRH